MKIKAILTIDEWNLIRQRVKNIDKISDSLIITPKDKYLEVTLIFNQDELK